jgi:ABC-2 type transport system permease protein
MTAFAGTWALIRFILRRDRVRVPIWIVGIVITVAGTALVLPDTFPTQQDRQTRAELVANPAFKMLLGPGIGLEDYTFGAMMSNEMLGITSIAIALMSIFMVVRHTRAEEESGRAELIRSSVVGRHAAMTAVLVVATIVNVLIAGLVAIALTASLEELRPGGSIVFGAALAAVGIAFAAVAAVTVQINEFSKGATGMAAATLGVTYAIRGFGDVQQNVLSWLSPLGWALKTEPYVGNRWWPLALLIGLTAMLVPVAYALSVRRDIAAGISPPRPGPATASTLLGRPFGMVVRLHRGSLLGWAVGITLFASAVGLIVPDAADMVAENPVAQEYLQALGLDETAVIDSALSLYISIFALIASIYTVGTVARLRV